MSEWKLTDNRVHGHGQNYTLPNRKTAQQLHKTLTNYEKTTILNTNIEQQHDKITRQIIQLQLTNSILTEELTQLKEEIKELQQ